MIRRTVRRASSREVLWNGNVEPPLRTFFTEPDVNIIRWAIKTQSSYRDTVPAIESSHPAVQVVRLRGQRQVERWFTQFSSFPHRS